MGCELFTDSALNRFVEVSGAWVWTEVLNCNLVMGSRFSTAVADMGSPLEVQFELFLVCPFPELKRDSKLS